MRPAAAGRRSCYPRLKRALPGGDRPQSVVSTSLPFSARWRSGRTRGEKFDIRIPPETDEHRFSEQADPELMRDGALDAHCQRDNVASRGAGAVHDRQRMFTGNAGAFVAGAALETRAFDQPGGWN